jgi:hypothetical protein
MNFEPCFPLKGGYIMEPQESRKNLIDCGERGLTIIIKFDIITDKKGG